MSCVTILLEGFRLAIKFSGCVRLRKLTKQYSCLQGSLLACEKMFRGKNTMVAFAVLIASKDCPGEEAHADRMSLQTSHESSLLAMTVQLSNKL